MGMPAAFKPDIGESTAELVFGEPLRLPGQFFHRGTEEPHTIFAQYLHRTFTRLRHKETAWHQSASGRPVFVSPSLRSATYMFLRVHSYRSPLQPSLHKGPYRVVERGPKSYLLELDGGIDSISIGTLKPAFLLAAQPEAGQLPSDLQPVQFASDAEPSFCSPAVTRSDRVPRPPARYSDSLLGIRRIYAGGVAVVRVPLMKIIVSQRSYVPFYGTISPRHLFSHNALGILPFVD
ncbi:hypothetical protein M514_06519 [Trichuris suis]|uniref:Uncharacterized protein n=1 Tax=Trichuris suis TaxID=68888 RepID=A0A085N2X7_9BILA|nr:hypothetical protein M513_06519 [Trichuris suis]KFD63823.1 hypothetical protein M514_06519 [Trichuris suis]